MHSIELHEASEEFADCWQCAGRHIEIKSQGPLHSWLKADLNPPFLEHLSFRIGNQLFFVRIEDAEGRMDVPGNPTGVLTIADNCNGHACLMPMHRSGGEWVPDVPDWGLLDARTEQPINPVALVTDEKIEMTNWELQDFAVQIVREHIDKDLGYKLMSWQGNPKVDPSIWFVGDQGPEWIVVRAIRFPEKEAALPDNIQEIADSCSHIGKTGHFASVAITNSDDAFDASGGTETSPLWRGHGLIARFEGLAPVEVQSRQI